MADRLDAREEAGVLEGEGVPAHQGLGEETFDRVDGAAGQGQIRGRAAGHIGRDPVPRPGFEAGVDDRIAVEHGPADGTGQGGCQIRDEGGVGVAGAEVAERSRGNAGRGLVRRGEALLGDVRGEGDASAGAAVRGDGAVTREAAVGGHGGVAVDAELLGEGTHGWEQVPRSEIAPLDEGPHAAGDFRSGGAADLRGSADVRCGGSGARRGGT